METIEDYAFSKCKFETVAFPSALTTIGASAFENSSLQDLTLNEGLVTIGQRAFYSCSFKSVTDLTFPSTLKTIDAEAFASYKANYSNLQSITLNEGLETIGHDAFSKFIFKDNTYLTCPSTLKTIGANAFNTSNLYGVTLNEGLESIGTSAFYNCKITTFTIPSTVTSIGRAMFSTTASLTSVKVAEGNATYTSRDADGKECNVIMSIADKKLIFACNVSTLPQDMKAIGTDAFSTCTNLKELELPASVETLDMYALSGCSAQKVTLGENVTSIGMGAFGNSGLQTLVFNSLEPPTFNDNCFLYAYNLTTISVPADNATLEKYKAQKVLQGYTFITHGNRFYAVVGKNDNTLTFRYDPNLDFGTDVDVFEFGDFGREYSGTSLNTMMTGKGYSEGVAYIKTVKFDESVADFRPTSCADWFNGFSNLTDIYNLGRLNTEEVTSMANMFAQCGVLASTNLDFSSFNTAKVTTMQQMFYYCQYLYSLDLSSFNTEKVTDMTRMFYYAVSLHDIYVSDGFKTDKVSNSSDMFRTTHNLKAGDKKYANYTENGNFKKKVGTLGGEPLGAKEKSNVLTLDELTLADNKPFVLTETAPVTAAKAQYSRTMTSKWGTLCLPYAINADDEEASCLFYAIEEMTDDAITLKQLDGTISAGTPVIFCRKGTEGEATVSGSGVLTTETGTDGTLAGTFETIILGDADYFISKDAFRLAGDYKSGDAKGVKVAPYRAYIQGQGGTQPSVLRIMGGQATGISDATADDLGNGAAQYYTIDGRRTDSLHKGLNIVKVGGKTRKVIVK